jgi:hypothetical protein
MAGTITSSARFNIVEILVADSQVNTPWLGVGIGPGTSEATDVALFEEVQNRTPGNAYQVTTVTSGDTYQWIGTFYSDATQTLTNLGLFSTSTSPIQGQLATQVSSTTQSYINPTDYYSWPTSYPFQIQVGQEVMTVISGNNYNTLYVERGQNNSTALSMIPAGTWITQNDTSLFVKTDFTGLSLSSGDSIEFFINIQFQ